MKHQFLSPEWISAAKEIRSEYSDRIPATTTAVKANVAVTENPFGEDDILGYVDTSQGAVNLEIGTLDDAELAVRLPYDIAKALFVTQDIQAMTEAFMMGKIVVTGDVSRLLALSPSPNPEQASLAHEVAERLEAITAD